MKKYLIIFIQVDGSFAGEEVQGADPFGALENFDAMNYEYTEIFSITLIK